MPKKAEPTDVPAVKVADQFKDFIERLRQTCIISPEVAEIVKAHIERSRGEFGG